jgi:phage-related minor tail protein
MSKKTPLYSAFNWMTEKFRPQDNKTPAEIAAEAAASAEAAAEAAEAAAARQIIREKNKGLLETQEKQREQIKREAEEAERREQIKESLKQQADAQKFDDLKKNAPLVMKDLNTKFNFKDFYDIIIKINDEMMDLRDKKFKNDEDLEEVISYNLIGNNGKIIDEDIPFKLLSKDTFTLLSKIDKIYEIDGIEDLDINFFGNLRNLDNTLNESGLSTINLGRLMNYNYITINDGNGKVSGIKYTINNNVKENYDKDRLAIIPLLLGIIVALHINNKDKSEGEKKEYIITLKKKEQGAQQGGKNKKNKKPTKPTITGKKEILGKQRCIYKKAGDRKEYVKYKGDLITVKDYKKIISVKKTKK